MTTTPTTPATHTLEVPGATIAYDVRGPLPTADGRPPLLLVGQPMDAYGFTTLAGLLTDRTLVTYDPRGLGRSTRHDGETEHRPEQQAEDLHRLVETLEAGPVDVFGSSGGAVTALQLVLAHPTDVRTLVAHEPPVLAVVPDADAAFAAERRVQEVYQERGWGAGMAAFVALTTWAGPFPEGWGDELPDPAAFGLPTEDDGSRDDPLLSGGSNAVTAWRPDVAALRESPVRIVLGIGIESAGLLTGRTTEALAAAIDRPLVTFPSGHGGFMGDEYGQRGEPEPFARVLREVLDEA